jgi:hypothetical protein
MALKRKRSAIELHAAFDSSPQSTSSVTTSHFRASTSPTPCPQYPKPTGLQIDRSASPYQAWVVGTPNLSSELGSRTRKRHRDDKPDDGIVHRMYRGIKEITKKLITLIETTIEKLFAAQRRHPQPTPVLSEAMITKHDRSMRYRHQPTLHAFWDPGHAFEYSAVNESMETIRDLELNRCAHCDNLLRSSPGAAMDVPLELDAPINEMFGCHNCARLACDMCAVEMEHRVCLECAISKRDGDCVMR